MSSASGNLRALVDEFYRVWFRFHQEAALKAEGWHSGIRGQALRSG